MCSVTEGPPINLRLALQRLMGRFAVLMILLCQSQASTWASACHAEPCMAGSAFRAVLLLRIGELGETRGLEGICGGSLSSTPY